MPAHKTPNVCRGCKAPLTEANWGHGNRKWNNKQCVPCHRAYQLEHYRTHREKRLEDQKARQRQRRARLMEAYGGQCACCGEADDRFLTVDHVFNDGNVHRRDDGIRGGAHFYLWLERQGFPRDRFQLLCFNCNHAKHIYGVCPHQSHEVKEAI